MGLYKKIFLAVFFFVYMVCVGCGNNVPDKENTITDESFAEKPDNKNNEITYDGESALSLEFRMSGTSTMRDGKVEIPIEITQNDGFAGIGLEIIYDNEVLKFEGIQLHDAFNRFHGISECTEVPKSNIVRASYIFAQDIYQTGQFAVLSFRVEENANASSPSVNVSIRDITRLNDDKVITGNEESIQINIGE